MSSEPSARSASSTITKNSGATTSPWLTACSSAPCAPWAAASMREDPERDEAELRDRRVAEDQPRVGLREGLHRAVEDRDHREDQQDRVEVLGRGREQRQHEPQEAVGGDLRDTPEKNASAGSGIVRYASGIQPWNGNAGILIRNASANVTKIHFCVDSGSGLRCRSESTKRQLGRRRRPTARAVATAPASISSEPTSV